MPQHDLEISRRSTLKQQSGISRYGRRCNGGQGRNRTADTGIFSLSYLASLKPADEAIQSETRDSCSSGCRFSRRRVLDHSPAVSQGRDNSGAPLLGLRHNRLALI